MEDIVTYAITDLRLNNFETPININRNVKVYEFESFCLLLFHALTTELIFLNIDSL